MVLITYPQCRTSNEQGQLISNKARGQECSLNPLCMSEHQMLWLSPKLGRPTAPKSTLCMLGILHDFCRLMIKIHFLENFFQIYHQSVNQFESKLGTTCVGPDLVPNCLQTLSADDISR